MYLNISWFKRAARITPWLTLTWDVFKFSYCYFERQFYNGLTLTWDVFKLYWKGDKVDRLGLD